tara:strand:+ start:68 stop:580 length:513 start_codon:yes stop_codon:yes gene_type:complete
MPQEALTPEARTPTALKVENTVLAPMDKIVSKHIKIDMKSVRANENSTTAYDHTLKDNLTGVSIDMKGTFTVGQESTTMKPTLGFDLDAFLRAVHGSNNPAMNKFMRAFADASIMAQMGASKEDIEAHHALHHIVSSKKTDLDFKAWKKTLQAEMLRPYSAVVKIYPSTE